MKRFDADASRRIIFLSFVCSCLVVLWHAHFLGIAKKGTFVANRILQDVLSQGVARASVPYFLVVFGFFLFCDWPFNIGCWHKKVISRAKSLMLPYVLWVLIGLAGAFLFPIFVGHAYAELEPTSLRWWCGVFGLRSGVPIVSYHLWFVRNIFFITLASPMIGVVLFRTPKVLLTVLFITAIVFDQYLGGKSQQLFFVCLGAWLAKEKVSLTWIDSNVGKLVPLWCILIVAKTFLAMFGFDIRCMMPILNLAGVAALWGLSRFVSRFGVKSFMECSFFVYCLHLMFLQWSIESLKMIVKIDKTMTGVECLMLYIVPPLMTVVVCYGIAALLRNRLPWLYVLLSGGRK